MKTLAVCIIDTRDHNLAAQVLAHTVHVMANCYPVSQAYWISDHPIQQEVSVSTKHIPINPISNFPLDYNHVCLQLLPDIIQEDHVLIIQTDGFPVNPESWSSDFLNYDYVGSPFNVNLIPHAHCAVGNGGFSLRSKKLLKALSAMQIKASDRSEDIHICWDMRDLLQQSHGIQFAPLDLAYQFGIDLQDNFVNGATPVLPHLGTSFGFHGKQNLAQVYYGHQLPAHLQTPIHNTTLSVCCIDTLNHAQAASAVMKTITCLKSVHDTCAIHWFSDKPFGYDVSVPVHWHKIPAISEFPLDYNKVCLELLPRVVQEDYCLIVQADGYAVNPSSWTPEFLKYDYIGSPFNLQWLHNPYYAVGNGGFSLRSKRLHQALINLDIKGTARGEDVVICWDYRLILEQQHDIQFAPLEIANQFGMDLNLNIAFGPSPNLSWLGKSFGFHGMHDAKIHYGDHIGEILPNHNTRTSNMKIAVYAIALNEEHNVDAWFNSVREADYWLVADTGSTDQTVSKLRHLGVKCEHIVVNPWRFDLARNIALSLIPTDVDICISMDMDEMMAPGWRTQIEQHWTAHTTKLKYTYVQNFDQNDQPVHSFMADKIHSRFGYQWRRPVHETIVANGDELTVNAPSVIMWHKQDAHKQRAQYLPLLELSHKEYPQCSETVFWLAQAYSHAGKNELAIMHLKNYLIMEDASCEDKRAEASTILSKLCAQDELKWLLMALGENPNRREGWFNLADYYYKKTDWVNLYATALQGTLITHRSNSQLDYPHAWGGLIWDLAGLGAWNMGLKEQSLLLFEQANILEPQDARIQNNYQFVMNYLNTSSNKNGL